MSRWNPNGPRAACSDDTPGTTPLAPRAAPVGGGLHPAIRQSARKLSKLGAAMPDWSGTIVGRARFYRKREAGKGGVELTRRDVTYPPLDCPKPVAADLWIVDSGPITVAVMHLPVRMTVLRLEDGGLLLHSPTPFSSELLTALERLGPVRHLLAPSYAHWMFVADWQRACPAATVWAAPGLARRRQVRESGLRIDGELGPDRPRPWGEAIEVSIVPGGGGFREAALFHRPSGTLVLTDLIVSLARSKLPFLQRLAARAIGSLAPDGKAPLYLRLLIGLRRRQARRAAERLVAFAPERVIFAHGEWFEREGQARLRRSLRWLLDQPGSPVRS